MDDLKQSLMMEAIDADDGSRAAALISAPGMTEDLKADALYEAITRGSGSVVDAFLENVGFSSQLAPERIMLLLYVACQAGHPDICASLALKAETGAVPYADIANLVMTHLAVGQQDGFIRNVVARAHARQEALDAFFERAGPLGNFSTASFLLDAGADPNAGGGVLLYFALKQFKWDAHTLGAPERLKNGAKPDNEYHEFLRDFLSRYKNEPAKASALAALAKEVSAGAHDKEVVDCFIDSGFDPYIYRGLCGGTFQKTFLAAQGEAQAAQWRAYFTKAAAQYTERHCTLFQEKYGQDLACAAGGAEGLSCAIRGGRLPALMESIASVKGAPLTPAAILQKGPDGVSALQLADDREQLDVLFSPAYWAGRDARIVERIYEALPENEKYYFQLEPYAAAIKQAVVQKKVRRYVLKPG